MKWLHATLYTKVASCELKRHDVLDGCRPKNVAGVEGSLDWVRSRVFPPPTSVVLRLLLLLMLIKRNACCRNSLLVVSQAHRNKWS